MVIYADDTTLLSTLETFGSHVSINNMENSIKNVGGAMHFIYYINRLTATKVDSTYFGCLTSNTQRISCLWQGSNA